MESIVLPLNYTPSFPPLAGVDLLLAFFMGSVFLAPLAEFLQFQFLITHFFAFVGEIIGFLADLTLHFDEWFFCHIFILHYILISVSQWSDLNRRPPRLLSKPERGFEPPAYSLPWSCSTSELLGHRKRGALPAELHWRLRY